MKQIIAIALTLVLIVGLCACGRRNKSPETMPSTVTTTVPVTTEPVVTTRPTTNPTIATNIPDPSVDTSIPEMTDLLPTEETALDTTGAK